MDGRKIAANHFDYIARPIARSGEYDLVCFVHNHRISLERYGRTTAINPGPVMGAAFGPDGWQEVAPTFAICDTGSMDLRGFAVVDRSTVQPFEITARPGSAARP